MEIETFKLTRLRNEDHYLFNTRFKRLVLQFSATALNIVTQFDEWQAAFDDEGTAIEYVRKSSITDQLVEADGLRDDLFGGFMLLVKGNLHHYNSGMRMAAERVNVITDHFGNLAQFTFTSESASIINMIAELGGADAPDIAALGLHGWITELQNRNNAFIELFDSRLDESAGKTALRMKEVRLRIDTAYNAIIKRINAGIVFNGEAPYADFVKLLNESLLYYRNLLARQVGGKDKGEPAATGPLEQKPPVV